MSTRIALTVALLIVAGVIGQLAHYLWPARDCVQIGEYTCVDKLP